LRANSAAFVAIVLEQIPNYNFEKSDLAKRLHEPLARHPYSPARPQTGRAFSFAPNLN
jgi:hypothetical protein